MRTARLLTIGALGAALLLPSAAFAQAPAGTTFTATLSLKSFTKTRTVALTAGKQNVPSGKSVTGWYVSEAGAPDPAPGAAGWKTVPTDFKLSDADGAHTVYIWAKATGGVVSDRASDTTFLDRVAPSVDNLTTTPAQAVAPEDPLLDRPIISTRTVSLSFEYSDPGETDVVPTGSGVVKYATVNGTATTLTPPVPGSLDWKVLPVGTPVVVNHKVTAGNGNKRVGVYVRDRAGNVSLAAEAYFKLQLAGPTVTLTMKDYSTTNKPSITVKGTPGANTTVAGFFLKVTSDPVAPDAPAAGAAGWKVQPTVVTLSAPGFWYVWAWAKDDNGSVSATPAMDSVWYDAAAPTGTLEIDEVENGSNVDTTSDRVINILTSASDGLGSGVAKYALIVGGPNSVPTTSDFKSLPIPSTFTLPLKNGTKTLKLYLKDSAGNVSAATTDDVIMTIPAPTMTVDLPVYSKSLTVSGILRNPSDPGGTGIDGFMFKQTNAAPLATDAGWTVAPGSFTFTAGEGLRTLYAWVKDKNGSVSAVAATDTVTIDTVKPIAVLTVSGTDFTLAGSDVGTGVTAYALVRTSVAADLPSAPTLGSAWKATADDAEAALLPALQSGGNRVTMFVKDVAGNTSVVDTTGPDVNSLLVTLP